eukprot:m.307456 g.307456  ORF g.307456 m.307456 type:complete len:1276 (-) comp20008_c0_seq1:110-3937(-)
MARSVSPLGAATVLLLACIVVCTRAASVAYLEEASGSALVSACSSNTEVRFNITEETIDSETGEPYAPGKVVLFIPSWTVRCHVNANDAPLPIEIRRDPTYTSITLNLYSTMENVFFRGIKLYAWDNALLYNSTVMDCDFQMNKGSRLSHSYAGGSWSSVTVKQENVVIEYSTIGLDRDGTPISGKHFGLLVRASASTSLADLPPIRIEHNKIVGHGRMWYAPEGSGGICVSPASSSDVPVVIANNTISRNHNAGIVVSAINVLIADNIIDSSYYNASYTPNQANQRYASGIQICRLYRDPGNIVVENNLIFGNAESGIQVTAGSNSRVLEFINNTIRDNGIGIDKQTSTLGVLQNNFVYNNRVNTRISTNGISLGDNFEYVSLDRTVRGTFTTTQRGVARVDVYGYESCDVKTGQTLGYGRLLFSDMVNMTEPGPIGFVIQAEDSFPPFVSTLSVAVTSIEAQMSTGLSSCIIVTNTAPTCDICTCQGTSVDCSNLLLLAIPPIPRNTTVLNMAGNRLHQVDPLPEAYPSLEELDLTNNVLAVDPTEAFLAGNATKLRSLLMGQNLLASLPHFLAAHFPALEILDLGDNLLTSFDQPDALAAPTLRMLRLANNRLSSFAGLGLDSLPALETVNFERNHFASIPANFLAASRRLASLDMKNNRLTFVADFAFAKLEGLVVLDLGEQSSDEIPVGNQLANVSQHLQAVRWMGSECPRGYGIALQDFPLTLCTPCPTGSFIPAGSQLRFSCAPCPPGETDDDSDPSSECTSCADFPGFFTTEASTGPCETHPCVAGTADHDTNASTPCATCPIGSYAPEAATSCTTCRAGTSDHDFSAATPCLVCTPGRFVPAGSTSSCDEYLCAAGTVDHDSDPSTDCITCSSGVHVPAGQNGSCSLFACTGGSEDHDNNPATACVPKTSASTASVFEEQGMQIGLPLAILLGVILVVGLVAVQVVRRRRQRSFHVFISYRVASEELLAKAIYHQLQGREIVLDTGGKAIINCQVFLDCMSLEVGRSWRRSFLRALRHSCVIIPLVSHASLDIMRTKLKNRETDNVLAEWSYAAKLGRAHRTLVMPVLIGDFRAETDDAVDRQGSTGTRGGDIGARCRVYDRADDMDAGGSGPLFDDISPGQPLAEFDFRRYGAHTFSSERHAAAAQTIARILEFQAVFLKSFPTAIDQDIPCEVLGAFRDSFAMYDNPQLETGPFLDLFNQDEVDNVVYGPRDGQPTIVNLPDVVFLLLKSFWADPKFKKTFIGKAALKPAALPLYGFHAVSQEI